MLGEHDATRIQLPAEEPATANSPAGPSDAELALAARSAPQAFEQLYQRYADRLYRYAAGLTGSTSQADDIVSDTMIAAFEQLQRFDPARGSFAGWLFTIARRRIVDDQRRLSRLRRAFQRHGPESSVADDPLTSVIRSEDAARLRAALLRLAKHDRDVLLLRFVVELSGPEIADILQISPGAVRVRVHRALGRLSIELGDDDGRA
jgi:RNA polymerase sigma-70 factor (ECF subfamily)